MKRLGKRKRKVQLPVCVAEKLDSVTILDGLLAFAKAVEAEIKKEAERRFTEPIKVETPQMQLWWEALGCASQERLEHLATSQDELIRLLVAQNPNTSPKTLFLLCDDADEAVRKSARDRI